MADQLHVDTQAAEQVAEENHLGTDADHLGLSAQVRRHVDLVGDRGEIVGGRPGRLHIGNNGLAAGTETGQGGADLTEVGHAGDVAVRAQVDILDGRILRGCVDRLYGVPKADNRAGRRTAAGKQGHGIEIAEGVVFQRLLAEADLRQVEAQDAGLGQDGLAAAGRDGGAEQPETQDQADDPDQDNAAHDGQGHFDKIFHCVKGKFDKSR